MGKGPISEQRQKFKTSGYNYHSIPTTRGRISMIGMFLPIILTLLVLLGPLASPFKISKYMLPKPYRHPCDPNHAEYPKKCEENKARVQLEKVKKREFFCKVYKICIEYSEGTLMLNVHQFWKARELVPHLQSSLPFPTRTIHDIVRHWHGADRSNPLWWQPHHYAKLATTTIDPIT